MAIFLNHTLVGETGTAVGISLAPASSQDTPLSCAGGVNAG